MKIEIENESLKKAAAVAASLTTIFGLYFMLDEKHISEEISDMNDTVVRQQIHSAVLSGHQRLLMAASTRYAEIAKYYHDLEKERPLLEAEKKRLALVEKQQERIAAQLLETTDTQ